MLFRFADPRGRARLGLAEGDRLYDLTATGDPHFESLAALLGADEPAGALRARVREAADRAPRIEAPGLLESGRAWGPGGAYELLAPVDAQEVWAAGVTYKRSEEARKAES